MVYSFIPLKIEPPLRYSTFLSMSMQIRKFEAADYPAYQTWFKHPDINQHLGPIDEEWLQHILEDKAGAQFCFLEGEKLLAVVGVVWANSENPFHVISDIAVNPKYQRQGLGQKAIHQLLAHHDTSAYKQWSAYVHHKNNPAQGFFKSLGWINDGLEDHYFRFSLLAHP